MCDTDPLTRWLERKNITGARLAETLKVSPSAISRLRQTGRASHDLMDAIRDATAVSPNHWSDYRKALREARARKGKARCPC